jgi:hypothetical protein
MPVATNDHGSKDANDFADQQVPQDSLARGVSGVLSDKVEGARTGNGSHPNAGEMIDSRGEETITSTSPPPNDSRDKALYTGDRTVIFVGTRRLNPSNDRYTNLSTPVGLGMVGIGGSHADYLGQR